MPEHYIGALSVQGLVAGYGNQVILHNVGFKVAAREIVAIIGHNGAGKSTLFRAVFGLARIVEGRILVGDEVVPTPSAAEMLNRGVALVPQGSRVFTDLTVRENLLIAAQRLGARAARDSGVAEAMDLFPELRPRQNQRAGSLSGGEKQVLSLAIALVGAPSVLLLDEPSLGLAPSTVRRVMERIGEIKDQLGVAIAIIEQNVRAALWLARRVYVLRNGQCSFEGPANELQDDEAKLREAFL